MCDIARADNMKSSDVVELKWAPEETPGASAELLQGPAEKEELFKSRVIKATKKGVQHITGHTDDL